MATPQPPALPQTRADDTPRSLALGQQLLIYTPDGPVGGTFTCTQCRAQAWQPELLGHAAGCLYRPADAAAAIVPAIVPAITPDITPAPR